MGKGRNRRRRLKRLKISIEKKKKQRATESSKNKTPLRAPKSRRRRRGGQRSKGNNMTNKLQITPGNKQGNPVYINMAISTAILLNNNITKQLGEIKNWLEKGVLTRLVIFSYGKHNSTTRRRLKEILVEKGLDWAWPYIISPMGNENTHDFINRIIKCWDINYFVDGNARTLKYIIMQRKYADMNMFYFDKEKAGWEKLVIFLRKNNPRYWGLRDKHEKAFDIISSKYYWDLPVATGDNNELSPETTMAGDNSEL